MGSSPVEIIRLASERLKGNCFVGETEAVEDGDCCCADTEHYIGK